MQKLIKSLVGPALVVLVVAAGVWLWRERLFSRPKLAEDSATPSVSHNKELKVLELGTQARKNLNLVAKPARATDYWRTVTIPGVIADRPGVSDRGVTSPAVGGIAEIHVFPGDTVRPGERLVTIQLFSEYLQSTQTQLFTASQEIELLQKERDRISSIANAGAISQSRMIDVTNDIQRQQTLAKAARQELLNRGLSPRQIDRIAGGDFISSIDIVAPPPRTSGDASKQASGQSVVQADFVPDSQTAPGLAYEVQSLAVELGQTVQAGQRIADLANHRALFVVGHAFKREASFLAEAAQEGRAIDVEFADETGAFWPPIDQTFQIRHLSNSIDPQSRTFDFFIPLANQSRTYEKEGETFVVWRFRPGQRARIHVPVEQMENVFVLPAEAVAQEGPAAYVYRQNGDLFNQIAVHILHEDRRYVVIANDGSITPGTYLAQNAAASLRRVLKAQSASGEQPGLHVHADGTVHAAH